MLNRLCALLGDIMIRRILWVLFRRYVLNQRVCGFGAHWTSFVDSNSSFGGYNNIGRRCSINGSSLGRFTYVSADTKINRATVGSFCSIGQESIIGGLAKHPTNWLSTHPAFFSKKCQAGYSFVDEDKFTEQLNVDIGHDVWIGARVMVLDGCRIGNGAIIAAGAVVVNDVPPYAIFGGVPAKLIRYRFDQDKVKKLIDIQWWNWSIEELKASPLAQGEISERAIRNE